jgi:hypothetical protein
MPACQPGPNAGPPSPCGAVGGHPWGSSPGSPHCYLAPSVRGPSVTPKTPPGASRGLASSHSIPIGEDAVGPPRSRFAFRLCDRKADEAGGKPRSTTALRIQASAESAPWMIVPALLTWGRNQAGASGTSLESDAPPGHQNAVRGLSPSGERGMAALER